jgi:predicted transcriptional regulator of viral defense system
MLWHVPSSSTLSKLAGLAPDQWGLVTRRQAEEAGISQATMTRLTADASTLERVGHGVYHLVGAPIPDHLPLRVAWLQLAPEVPAWRRTADEGVVSHRSAAALYGLGHLPADEHHFTVSTRRRSRRPDVKLHVRKLADHEWVNLRGLPVTRPSRIASDLVADREEPGAVAQLVADAIRNAYDYPGTFADALAPHAAAFGFRRGDGLALLRSLLDLAGDPDSDRWVEDARAHVVRSDGAQRHTPPPSPTTSMRPSS